MNASACLSSMAEAPPADEIWAAEAPVGNHEAADPVKAQVCSLSREGLSGDMIQMYRTCWSPFPSGANDRVVAHGSVVVHLQEVHLSAHS